MKCLGFMISGQGGLRGPEGKSTKDTADSHHTGINQHLKASSMKAQYQGDHGGLIPNYAIVLKLAQ